MSEREPATSVGLDTTRTDVGSVFVSNYPPYSFWSREGVDAALAALDASPRPGVGLGLYLHVPFCRRRCKFCYFKVFTDKNAGEIHRYCSALLREAETMGRRAAIEGRPLRLVYVGGGTPSYISARELRRLFRGLRDALSWDEVSEVTFECEPGTLTRPKLEAIRDVGVTRLSLGVENFDDTILRENGRAHVTKEIDRVIPWIRDLDFPQLNVDLIAGMVGETDATWQRTVERTLEIDPDSVTIYQMELPFNTVYSRSVLDGRPVGVADWPTKRAWHDWAIERFREAGYEVSSAYTVVKAGRGTRFEYRDALWHGNDLLGLGVSSFSHVGGTHFQNTSVWGDYLECIDGAGHAIERAYATDAEERLTREWILQLKLGHVAPAYFQDKFGIDVLSRFAVPLARLADEGMLRIEPDAVRLTRAGLLRVDQLLPAFYAARHQNARYT